MSLESRTSAHLRDFVRSGFVLAPVIETNPHEADPPLTGGPGGRKVWEATKVSLEVGALQFDFQPGDVVDEQPLAAGGRWTVSHDLILTVWVPKKGNLGQVGSAQLLSSYVGDVRQLFLSGHGSRVLADEAPPVRVRVVPRRSFFGTPEEDQSYRFQRLGFSIETEARF